MTLANEYVRCAVPSAAAGAYSDARAHELRARYLATFGGDEIPVPVRSIAEDLLGLRVMESELGDCSGMLLPAERCIVLNTGERTFGEGHEPVRRHTFTIAHELGHWICHAKGSETAQPTYCRSKDLAQNVDRALEREANVFAAELLMPESVLRVVWDEVGGSTTSPRDEATRRTAERLGVSPTAVWWRLYSYGLVPERPVAEGN